MIESEAGPGVKHKVIFAACVLAGMVLAVWLAGAVSREPMHKGKPVRWWVDQACDLRVQDAVHEVGRIGPPAVPYLITKLKPETWLHRNWVRLHDIVWVGLHDVLPERIRDKWPVTQRGVGQQEMAARCLQDLGPAGKPAVPMLCRELADPHAPSFLITQALGAIGEGAASAVPALHDALANKPPGVQVEVVRALCWIAHDTNTALEVCQRLISRRDSSAVNACNLLGDLGLAAAPLVPLLVHTVRDSTVDRDIRVNGLAAIGKIGVKSPEVVDALLVGLRDADLLARAHSATSLWRLDPQRAALAVPVVVDSLVDWNRRNPASRLSLAQLAQGSHLNLASARGKLVELSQNGSPDVREIAVEALQSIDTESAVHHRGK